MEYQNRLSYSSFRREYESKDRGYPSRDFYSRTEQKRGCCYNL